MQPAPLSLLTLDQATRQYNVSRATLYRYIARGQLRSFKRPGDRRSYIPREQLERLLEGFHPRPARRRAVGSPSRTAGASPPGERRPSARSGPLPFARSEPRAPLGEPLPVTWLHSGRELGGRRWRRATRAGWGLSPWVLVAIAAAVVVVLLFLRCT